MANIVPEFETQLWIRKWLAYGAGILYKSATWLSAGTLTWATVVLMGGFASNLALPDFITVTLLVLLIIVLLLLARSTCKLVTSKSLSTGSLQPLELVYKDRRLFWVNSIKLISCVFQVVLLVFTRCISVSNIRDPKLIWDALSSCTFVPFFTPHVDDVSAVDSASVQACLKSCATKDSLTTASALQTCFQDCFSAQNSAYTAITNLQVCLFTFHSLVLATCAMVFLCNVYVLCRVAWWLLFVRSPKTLSMTRYHDEMLSRTLSIGLIDAYDFDAAWFLVRGVGEDLVVRNIAPLGVRKQNEDFIKYLFYYSRGVEMVMGMLNASEDALLQQTAANMPGFWSSEHQGMKRYGMELLSKLGEKLGYPGKVAEGAANSFKSLAVAWREEDPSPLLKVYVSRSEGRRRQGRTGAVASGHVQILAPGEVASSALESMVGGGDSTLDAASRSEAGGLDEREGEAMSTPPESAGDHTTSIPGGAAAGHSVVTSGGESGGSSRSRTGELELMSRRRGSGRGDPSTGQVQARDSGGGRGNVDELKWNVVQKVVDLVANKRVPTLQVYVRALDAFFMSKSVRESLTEEEKDEIKRKLLRIVEGHPSGGSGRAEIDHASIALDSNTRPRTRLLAFSALERLGLDPRMDAKQMLQRLDDQLNQVQENSVIWHEEVERYKQLCKKYDHQLGEWPISSKWKIQGTDFSHSSWPFSITTTIVIVSFFALLIAIFVWAYIEKAKSGCCPSKELYNNFVLCFPSKKLYNKFILFVYNSYHSFRNLSWSF